MPWVKLDDQFPGHPKVVAAGGDAAWLYICGLCYCQAHLTDGVISSAILPRLSDRSQPFRLANKLVSVGLWDVIEGGYMVHDYAEHNTPAEKVKAKRAATRERVAKWRESRAGNADGNAVGNGTGNAVTGAFGNADCNASPLTANRNPLTATSSKDLAADGAAADAASRSQDKPKAKPKGRKARDPDATPELPLVCTKAQFTAAIAAASNGRYLDTPVGQGGSFKLNPLLRDPDALKKATAIGRWLAAGGDGFKGTLDGRHFGPNIDAWLAQAVAPAANTSATSPGYRHESARAYQPAPVVEDNPIRRTRAWMDAVKVAVARGMGDEEATAYADDIARQATAQGASA